MNEMKQSIPMKTGSHPFNETIGASTSPLMKKIKSEPSDKSALPSNKAPVAMTYAAYRERKERTLHETTKQSEQSVAKSNQSVKGLPQLTTKESNPHQRDRPNDKLSAKQQQMIIDKQKQIDERHKLKAKNPENLWDSSSRQTIPSKPISSSTHQKSSQNNVTTDDFYDNLLNKPSNFNSIFSTDGEDSLEFKKEITTDLKMEFSDNSNLSNDALNLSSFPSEFINDSSDSKKSLNNSNNNNINKLHTSLDSKPTSFMSIFSSPITTANTTTPATVPLKSENTPLVNPMKYNTNDFQNMLSRLKPEPPPPMLSPLKSAAEIESVSKLEKSFPTHSSVPTLLRPNVNSSQALDSKSFPNLKSSKTPTKSRNQFQTKSSVGMTLQNSPKELNESSLNISSDNLTTGPTIDSLTVVNNCNNNALNSNDLGHTSESLVPVGIKQENKEKPLKGAEVPSVLSLNRTQTSCSEFDIKPNNEFIPNLNSTLHLSPPQKLINNLSSIPEQSSNLTKGMSVSMSVPMSVQNKDVKEKTHEERHSEKHHKHSHKSSKHKDKHKHKHKDKDREKHKRKDKDRDRERDREKQNHSKDDSFKLSSQTDASKNSNVAPIKIKITKNKMSVDSPDKDNDVPQIPLKLKIQLKDQKLTSNTTDFESNETTSGRKRKSSPKSSKKEKISKHETEPKLKDEKSWTKTSSKSSKKSIDSNNSKKNLNLITDERYSTQPINPFGHQMLNLGIGNQTIGAPQGLVPQRSSKAHK